MKKNIYIALAILFFLLITLIENFSVPIRPKLPAPELSLSPQQLLNNPWAALLGAFSLFYLLLICIGIGYLLFFVIKACKNKIALASNRPEKPNFSEMTASKILFLTTLMILSLYILPAIILTEYPEKHLSLVMFALNGLMHLGIGIILLKYLRKSFNFQISGEKIISLGKTYCALLPLLTFSLLINALINNILKIEPAASPAVELLFSINTPGLLLFAAFQVIVSGPLVEEIFFRGFLYPLFRGRYGFFMAAGLLSFFFAALHKSPTTILPLFLISFTLCYIYEKTKSIGAVFIFHALHNGLNFLLFLIVRKVIQG